MQIPKKYSQNLLRNFCDSNRLNFNSFQDNYRRSYYPLINSIVQWKKKRRSTQASIVGLSAPQGAGKTTLMKLIAEVVQSEYGLNSVAVSIDDFYKTKTERKIMSEQIHPLFKTRGVPGTHDIKLAINTFKQLQASKVQQTVRIPRFDKANDDRFPINQWTKIEQPLDLILFEGWCLGALPQTNSQLERPVNRLEQEEDSNGQWRQHMNHQLAGEYQSLWAMVDYWIKVSAPSFEVICQWRKQQEEQLIAKGEREGERVSSTMNSKQLERFMMHFERITKNGFEMSTPIVNDQISIDEKRNALLI